MKIDQDIICDLYPLYFAGEASDATRALVEAYLAEHPDFARLMRESQEAPAQIPVGATGNATHAPIKRIQKIMRWRSLTMGIAIACSLMPFSFVFKGSQLTWFMLRDAPAASAPFIVGAIVAWTFHFILTRRLRIT